MSGDHDGIGEVWTTLFFLVPENVATEGVRPARIQLWVWKSTTGAWLKSVIAKSEEERLTTSSSNDSGTVVRK